MVAPLNLESINVYSKNYINKVLAETKVQPGFTDYKKAVSNVEVKAELKPLGKVIEAVSGYLSSVKEVFINVKESAKAGNITPKTVGDTILGGVKDAGSFALDAFKGAGNAVKNNKVVAAVAASVVSAGAVVAGIFARKAAKDGYESAK